MALIGAEGLLGGLPDAPRTPDMLTIVPTPGPAEPEPEEHGAGPAETEAEPETETGGFIDAEIGPEEKTETESDTGDFINAVIIDLDPREMHEEGAM